MDQIRKQLENPLVTGIAGLVVGIFIGLVLLGWWLWPVEYTDASPQDLIFEDQVEYLRMAVESYGYSGDATTAQQRWASLGESAANALEGVIQDPSGMDPKLMVDFNAAVGYAGETAGQIETELVTTPLAEETVTVPTQTVLESETTTSQPLDESESKSLLDRLWPILCLGAMILVAGMIALYILRLRGTPTEEKEVQAQTPEPEYDEPDWKEYPPSQPQTPLGEFVASYRLGDDLFDESFSIDAPSGEFLGECGVSISETIGVGDPKKVAAFEIWLFDKNDIQTITKVLMSAHAFSSQELRQQLATKGEPVLVQINGESVLETQSLQMRAKIVDFVYGSGAMPSESYFDRFTIQFGIYARD